MEHDVQFWKSALEQPKWHKPTNLCPESGTPVNSHPTSSTSILWRSSTAKVPGLGTNLKPLTISTAGQQHLRKAAANVSLHTIILGVGGTIYSPYILVPLKNLGQDPQKALQTMPYLPQVSHATRACLYTPDGKCVGMLSTNLGSTHIANFWNKSSP